MNRALDALEVKVREEGDSGWWYRVVCKFLQYELDLWGRQGRHMVNFAVIGFALFLAKNGRYFFDKKGELVIKTARTHVSEKRGSRLINLTDDDRSDFAKLQALKLQGWEKLGSRLQVEAPRAPLVVAGQINDWFWKNRPKASRVWRPELSW